MTVARMVALMVVMTLTGVAVVALRVDQRRTSWQIEEARFQQVDMKRELWSQQLELAQLRSPQAIRERAEAMGILAEPAE